MSTLSLGRVEHNSHRLAHGGRGEVGSELGSDDTLGAVRSGHLAPDNSVLSAALGGLGLKKTVVTDKRRVNA